MTQVLDFLHGNLFFSFSNHKNLHCNVVKFACHDLGFSHGKRFVDWKKRCCVLKFSFPVSCKLVDNAERSIEEKDSTLNGGNLIIFPHVQTLRDFPKADLLDKVVMVRFDPVILFERKHGCQSLYATAFLTIKYLHEAGAKVILVSSWSENTKSSRPSIEYALTESVADFLSSALKLNVVSARLVPRCMDSSTYTGRNSDILLLDNLLHIKGEITNCPKFAKELTSGVDIIVNDAFSQSHKVLASTVGVGSLCYAYIAGFYFEEELNKMKKIVGTSGRPYFAIIGGGKLADKAPALEFLTSICDGLIFVGNMALQILHATGVPFPSSFLELGAQEGAVRVVEYAKSRNVQLVLPKDFWCINDRIPGQLQSFSVHSIPGDWRPVDIGPRSLREINCFVSKSKEIIWIGPLEFSSPKKGKNGTIELVESLCTIGDGSCGITFVGKENFEDFMGKINYPSNFNFVKSSAVVWQVLKGRKLPGLLAIDRAYPFHINWSVAFGDPMRPLVVDVGSGNGMFLFGMARRRQHMNYLGLELNAKLVDRCLDRNHQLGLNNVHFINTNATSTFRSIVSSYPGQLVLVSIQCPNPDFNKPEYRWRMLQRSLVEAIIELLLDDGKVFLQSDIESVATRMKEEFVKYGKGKLVPLYYTEDEAIDSGGWLKENPFGVRSDWEQHVLDRGDPMYRLLLVLKEKKETGVN